LLCGSCGYDNPREHRYCGMCGTPFPHRPLTVPEAQSTLTFNSAPIDVAPSYLPLAAAEPPQPEALPATANVGVEETPPEPSETKSPERSPAQDLPRRFTPEELPAPALDLSQPAIREEVSPPASQAQFVASPPAPESHEDEHSAIAEAAALTAASETASADVPPPEAAPVAAQPAPEAPALAPIAVEPESPSPQIGREEASPREPLSMPEIRRYSPSHHEAPPARFESGTSNLTAVPRPQSTEPPPASAGMPTFQSVAEAAGAPPISPFEPAAEKNADDERELQEFVANFRYNPPEESVDELTMRSEVPVLDAEAPVTPSHPSFDDDVPPPPQAGPHPTGQEYYSHPDAPSDRTHFLEIEDSPRTAVASSASTASGTSLLGLSDPLVTIAPSHDDELAHPSNRRWLLWTSIAVLIAVFGSLGFLEGHTGMNHAYTGSVAIIKEQYSKLRQRVSELTAPKPAATAESPAAQPLSEVKPTSPEESAAKPPAESASNSTPATAPTTQPAATADQQPSMSPATLAQPAPPNDTSTNPPASAPPPAVVTQKPTADALASPAPDTTAAKHELTGEPPLVAVKPKSKSDPGQQELANALQASDPAATAAWLWKATSRGNPVAPVRLADMYIKGKGVPHSCEQALVLLRSEAAKDNAPARNRLAALYANGTCVTRDRVRAYQLMSSALAVDPTSEWAEQNRKELWQQMTPEERAQAEKYR
jgi:hypothetical protein